MNEILEEICIWNEHTRIKIPEHGIVLRNRDRQECLSCNGYNKDCGRYIAYTKSWRMKQDTKPYEDKRNRGNQNY